MSASTLAIGARVGPYDVLGVLGVGGMGEVYRARDPRLGREVALKVLPAALANDPERVARFTREAQVIAALDHPHIARLYGLEEVSAVAGAEGSTGTRAIVMELVEGETLDARLARAGRLPVDEVLTLARQLAEALEAAHEKGIVHRDLKPANLKVTPAGVLKVLDFGLAKGLASLAQAPGVGLEAPGAPGSDEAPTVTSPAFTQMGMLLGTAAYMSPEQARGKPVDTRADIWAFGCVVYELLTGQRAFGGQTVTDVLAAVVREEPDYTKLPREVPATVRRLLVRCLRKDARQRLQSIGDARVELEEAEIQDTAVTAASIPATPTVAGAARRVSTSAILKSVAALALLSAVLATVWSLGSRPLIFTSPEMRLEMTTPPTPDPISFAISPDGRQVTFVATSEGQPRLWVRALDSTSARVLAATDGASYPFWSPDSRAIGFFADGQLKRVNVDGGSIQTLVDAGLGQGGTWGRDGTILFANVAIGARILRVSATGGETAPVTELQEGQGTHRFPRFLPDGKRFLFFAAGESAVRGIYVGDLTDGNVRRLLDSDAAAVFDARSGHLLYVRQGSLHAQPLDLSNLSLGDTTAPIAEGVAVRLSQSVAGVSVSDVGHVVYRTGGAGASWQFTWVDRAGRNLAKVGDTHDALTLNPSLSPDGRTVAFSRSIEGYTDIWRLDTARGILDRATSHPGNDTFPVWSPDGAKIYFRREGQLMSIDASGRDESTVLPEASQGQPQDVSRDGRWLLYRRGTAGAADLWAASFDKPQDPVAVAVTRFDEYNGQFSPDARWVTYQTAESGRVEVVVQAFPDPRGKTRVTTNGGAQPRWSPDGKELFYVGLEGRLHSVPFGVSPSGEASIGEPTPLFITHLGGALQGMFRAQYEVSPDGQRFLMNTLVEEAASPLTILLNWRPPLGSQ